MAPTETRKIKTGSPMVIITNATGRKNNAKIIFYRFKLCVDRRRFAFAWFKKRCSGAFCTAPVINRGSLDFRVNLSPQKDLCPIK
jgi:hypothetical protein